MSIAGNWDCVTKTPMGDQKSVLTLTVDGNTFTGVNAGAMGSMEIAGGEINGDTITWKMEMKVPMPMTLKGTATVEGDTLTGSVNAGAFGNMAITGTRQA
jgi:hypothetical protein